jgi:hypothetical protein
MTFETIRKERRFRWLVAVVVVGIAVAGIVLAVQTCSLLSSGSDSAGSAPHPAALVHPSTAEAEAKTEGGIT